MMFRGKSSIKSSVTEKENSVEVKGRGYVRSNDYGTARVLSEDLTRSVDHYNEIAYNVHRRR